MVVRLLRGYTAARGPADVTLLEQVRLVDVLDRVARLAEGSSERLGADRAPLVILDDDVEEAAVHFVEASRVDLEPGGGLFDDRDVDLPGPEDVGVVADAPKRRLATRGVPRERSAIASAARGSIGVSSIRALRVTMRARSSGG